MRPNSAFDKLVLELNPSERLRMLEKLKAQQAGENTIDSAEIIAEHADKPNYSEYAAKLGFFEKIIIAVKSWIFNRPKTDLIKERMLRDIAHQFQTQHRGVLDPSGKMLLKPFYDVIIVLEKSLQYFRKMQEKTLDADSDSFYAFLVSLYVPEIHGNLIKSTDPWQLEKDMPNAQEHEIRSAMSRAVDSLTNQIPDSVRTRVYIDAHLLFILKELTKFPLKTLIDSFLTIDGKYEASLVLNTDIIRNLDSLLFELQDPPSPYLLEAFFLFYFRDKYSGNLEEFQALQAKETSIATQHFLTLQRFPSSVSLGRLLVLASRDPEAASDPRAGGEDWFAVYKNYWKDRIESNHKKYAFQKKEEKVLNEIKVLIHEPFQTALLFVSDRHRESVPVVKFAQVIKLIEAFYHTIFLAEMNKPLKILLLEGEFYKKDNKLEFTESYNTILQLPEMLARFDSLLSPEGEIGKQYSINRNDLNSQTVFRKKIDSVMLSVDFESDAIIKKTLTSLEKMIFILRGILLKQSNTVYDTLSNIAKIDGRNNKQYLLHLERIKEKLERFFYLVNDLYAIIVTKSKISDAENNGGN